MNADETTVRLLSLSDFFPEDSDAISLESELAELISEFSSLKMISLAIKIEQIFSVDITDNDKFSNIVTLNDLLEVIHEERGRENE